MPSFGEVAGAHGWGGGGLGGWVGDAGDKGLGGGREGEGGCVGRCTGFIGRRAVSQGFCLSTFII